MTGQVIFLELVSSQGVSADPQKVQTIVEWPELRSIRDVKKFSWACNLLQTIYKRV